MMQGHADYIWPRTSLARHFPLLSLYGATSDKDIHGYTETEMKLEAILEHMWAICYFLGDLCNSEDLISQLLYLRNLDEDTRGLFQGWVFGNDLLLAYAHVHHAKTFSDHFSNKCPTVGGGKIFSIEATVMLD